MCVRVHAPVCVRHDVMYVWVHGRTDHPHDTVHSHDVSPVCVCVCVCVRYANWKADHYRRLAGDIVTL